MSPSQQIAALNDALRTSGIGGKMLMSQGIANLEDPLRDLVVSAVMYFDNFTEDNDPYGEHDFGSATIQGMKVFWKIDYYDKSCSYRSENPADPTITTRVLTIMLAEEY